MLQKNEQFELAEQFVNQTGRHLFLTGKAGTGKTTFLHIIKENSPKKLAVVAPTGVAAINAGGVTIHSFFQLPFGSFLPGTSREPVSESSRFFDRQQLLKHLKLNSAKRELMRELDLLVVDEVSMVRADLLDAIDVVLRHVRRQPHLPFGGVQMLFIGDLFQLPPVVAEEEWKTLGRYYKSPFFFHANCLKEAPPLYLELKEIYRQSDDAFISLLNKLRMNTVQQEDLEVLQQYYRPDFKPEKEGEYVLLTTHNARADIINQEELERLPGRKYTFKAETSGEFNEKAVPAEKELQLKEGAQVMFIRNDKGEQRRYFNGKTGTVKRIKGDEILVAFPGEEEDILLEKESWKNLRYKYNKEADEVEEEVKGTFSQYPIRLAWAITIHKSQGLTFNKAIIDAGDSFAPGQVYVALSRLRSLEGLVLYSPIQAESILTNEQAVALSRSEPESRQLMEELKEARKAYIHQLLLQAFSWYKISSRLEKWKESLEKRRIPLQEEAARLAEELHKKGLEQEKVAEKFCRQLEQLLLQARENAYSQTFRRLTAAVDFFSKALEEELIAPLQQHLEKVKKEATKAKKYRKEGGDLLKLFQDKLQRLEQTIHNTQALSQGLDAEELLQQVEQDRKASLQTAGVQAKEAKPAKGESNRISLSLFKEGQTIEEIAAERELVPGTIESHLASFIPTGEISIQELVPDDKRLLIQKVLEEAGEDTSASEIKEILGEDVSYGEIKAVRIYLEAGIGPNEIES